MKPNLFFILLTSVLCFVAADLSHAQSPQQTPAPSQVKTPNLNQSIPDDIAQEMTVMKDNYAGMYNVSNLENLSKLYWRLGAFDTDDESSIESYIKINDCKIFKSFYGDDIEWKKIVHSMKGYLEKERNNFPLNYQFTLELNLGKYNMERGGFEVVNNTGFSNSKIIHVKSIHNRNSECTDKEMPKSYPKSVIILLEKPLTMDFVKLDEHVAQAFILRKKDDPRRRAYLRLRVNFTQYAGNLSGSYGEIYAVMNGRVDGYEIFEDDSQRSLLVSENSEDDLTQTFASSQTSSPARTRTQQIQESLPAPGAVLTGFAPQSTP